jgi:hypothetical protein
LLTSTGASATSFGGSFRASVSAICTNALAVRLSGWRVTTGTPASAASEKSGSIGIDPRKGTSIMRDRPFPLSCPKRCTTSPQQRQV